MKTSINDEPKNEAKRTEIMRCVSYAPVHWQTFGEIFKELKEFGIARETLKKRISELEDVLAREYKGKYGHIQLFYSPNSVLAIRKAMCDLITKEKAHTDWMSLLEIADKYSINRETLRKKIRMTDSLKHLKPVKFRNRNGRLTQFYSPSAVKIIISKFS